MSIRQTLIIVSGLPGTGKSTLAYRLARELQVPLLCIDDVVGEIPENTTVSFWDSKIEILLGLTEKQLELGLSVVVDSVFMNMDRHHAQALARKYAARFCPIHTFVSDETLWQERVMERYERLNHKSADWAQIEHQRHHFREWQPDTALFLDGIHSSEENFITALAYVNKGGEGIRPLDEIELVKGTYH